MWAIGPHSINGMEREQERGNWWQNTKINKLREREQ